MLSSLRRSTSRTGVGFRKKCQTLTVTRLYDSHSIGSVHDVYHFSPFSSVKYAVVISVQETFFDFFFHVRFIFLNPNFARNLVDRLSAPPSDVCITWRVHVLHTYPDLREL